MNRNTTSLVKPPLQKELYQTAERLQVYFGNGLITIKTENPTEAGFSRLAPEATRDVG
jgi:hypothetical protein